MRMTQRWPLQCDQRSASCLTILTVLIERNDSVCLYPTVLLNREEYLTESVLVWIRYICNAE